jgi:ABC-2 type transport system ATP-binding protein
MYHQKSMSQNEPNQTVISIKNLSKVYATGFTALEDINLDIQQGEIFALLGENGAGKTTLISTICGILTPSSGSITVNGWDVIADYKKTRSIIGLVPQELTLAAFDKVWDTIKFSRGLFGRPDDDDYLETLLKQLSLYDKKSSQLRTLSGGMKRRVLIAKALSHQPKILFLDEPTAGVDVKLRKDMWDIVRGLRDSGVTIILTTHYIEEAEEIADRIGVIDGGTLRVVEKTSSLMNRLGTKNLEILLNESLDGLPSSLDKYELQLGQDGMSLLYSYSSNIDSALVSQLLTELAGLNVSVSDIKTKESSLEDVFIKLIDKND